MLGEDHSLSLEFPEYVNKINSLNKGDANFANNAKRYHELDKKIRVLELQNSPISDDDLHQMKHERASLKDMLYQMIIVA